MRNTFLISQAVVLAAFLGSANMGAAQSVAAQPVTPDQLEHAIDREWDADATLKACTRCDFDVDVTGDVATISGEAPTEALRLRAAKLAAVKGIARVDNQIRIVAPGSTSDKAREGLNKAANKTAEGVGKAADKTGDAVAKTGEVIDDTWITTKVKAKYVGEDAVEGSDIHVDTNNNVVTLTGTVPTAAAHAAALRLARETKGVKRVVDQLRIAPKTN